MYKHILGIIFFPSTFQQGTGYLYFHFEAEILAPLMVVSQFPLFFLSAIIINLSKICIEKDHVMNML